ncbi:YcaO-like family protein [Lentibacillus saliphilus]|uniref:YcaO-like family protein n=1 Tax=Lentibacillus saliphilus TaxID=2737028 RepID=UPI001C2FFC4C|nr:YcaO-like family protein [Lentibacillus saliphilus]
MKVKLTDKSVDARTQHFDGKIGGLWKNPQKFYRLKSYPLPNFHFITSEFPSFEKFVYEQDIHFTYHLSGYGKLYNETRMSFLGESAERFAYASQYLGLKHLIVKKSYNDLVTEEGHLALVCPLDNVNQLYEAGHSQYILPTDEISWVKMNSLIDPEKSVYTPLQLMVTGTHFLVENEKFAIANAVSTGTASHETFDKSLEAAIIEVYQLDSYNLYWYGGLECPDITAEWDGLIQRVMDGAGDFFNHFDLKLVDITLDKPVSIVMCEITSNASYMPKYTVGIQGAYSMERAVYRAIMETMAIVEYNMNVSWTDKEKFKSVIQQTVFDNLDDNVLYYARLGKPDHLTTRANPLKAREKSTDLKELTRSLADFSTYAGFLNITPPDFAGCNQVITRIVVPELLPLCIPSFPPAHHPRYATIGGMLNDLAHPLP